MDLRFTMYDIRFTKLYIVHRTLYLSCIFSFILLTNKATAQEFVQTVKGTIYNQTSHLPVAGAEVSFLRNAEVIKSTTADSLGQFQITDLPPGRYKLFISSTGYEAYEDETLVLSGKELIVSVLMHESLQMLDQVNIKASTPSAESPGMHSISIEKTMRVAANFYDPVRMVTSYPGVVAANDQSNSIAAKGYSPNGLLWRLQGLDIVNPNHLANAGTLSDKPVANGGGVNVLSAQLLDKTDFYSGSLPVQYGNALSGVLDMNLRSGNKSKMEFIGQASLLGLDAAVEGPISKNKRTSFLANYRYSTVGLLSAIGVNLGDEIINFQDISFHINSDQKRGGNLSVFGFYGLSSNKFEHKPMDEWEQDKDRYDIDYGGAVFGVGFTEQLHLGRKVNLSFGSAASGQEQDRTSQSSVLMNEKSVYAEAYSNDRLMISNFVKSVFNVTSGGALEAGVTVNYLNNYLNSGTVTSLGNIINPPSIIQGRVEGVVSQPYVNWAQRWRAWKLNAGIRYVNFSYNSANSVEPRASLQRSLPKGSLVASYGITSQWQLPQTYVMSGNAGLGLTRAHQAALDFRYLLANDIRLTTTLYYHEVFDAPATLNGQYSTLNQWEDFAANSLTNIGKGKNYGVEVMVEKKFYNQFYFMVAGSAYRSTYLNQQVYKDTRFSGKYTSSLQVGKEWSRNNSTVGVHTRILYLGGLREAPIDSVFSRYIAGTTVYNAQNGYTNKLGNYFRPDLRISWRKNKPHSTRTLSLDIQNVANYTGNEAYHYYDTYLQENKTKYQLGMYPVLAYRIEF